MFDRYRYIFKLVSLASIHVTCDVYAVTRSFAVFDFLFFYISIHEFNAFFVKWRDARHANTRVRLLKCFPSNRFVLKYFYQPRTVNIIRSKMLSAQTLLHTEQYTNTEYSLIQNAVRSCQIASTDWCDCMEALYYLYDLYFVSSKIHAIKNNCGIFLKTAYIHFKQNLPRF